MVRSALIIVFFLLSGGLAGCAAPADEITIAGERPTGFSIDEVLATGIRHDQMEVSWTITTQRVDVESLVQYRPEGETDWSTSGVQEGPGRWTVQLSDLLPATLYEYQVVATSTGPTVEGSLLRVGTSAAPSASSGDGGLDNDGVTGPLQVRDVEVFNAGLDDAVIAYRIAGGAGAISSHVAYGTDERLGSTTPARAGGEAHNVTITGLQADTVYFFQVVASDDDGQVVSAPSDFQTRATPDNQAPVLEGLQVSQVDCRSARVDWTVSDESGVTSTVHYRTDGLTETQTATGTGPRSSTLTGLREATEYTVWVSAVDGAGNSAQMDPVAVETTGEAPTVSGITTSDVSLTGFKINFELTGSACAEALVEYGTSTAYGATSGMREGAGTQTIELSDLEEGTLYHFRVVANPGRGDVASADQTQYTATLYTVIIDGNLGPLSFDPAELGVAADQPLLFRIVNEDGSAHTWAIRDQGYESEVMDPDETFEFVTTIELSQGEYEQYCTLHPSMMGTVNAG